MIRVNRKIIVSDPNDLDEISIAVSRSVTGFTLERITGSMTCFNSNTGEYSYLLHVEGTLEHLNGFEDLDDLTETFLEA